MTTTKPLHEEPAIGSYVRDRDGVVWWRDEGGWYADLTGPELESRETWEYLVRVQGVRKPRRTS